MSSRTTDVNLIVRAKTEGEKTVAGLADVLRQLGDGAGATGGDLTGLAQTVATLDRAYAALSPKADAAAAALDRQQAALGANRAQLAAVEAQAESAARAMASIRTAVVDASLAGQDRSPLVVQLKEAERAQASLTAEAARLSAAIAKQEANLAGSQSSLLRLSSSVIAVEQAQAEAAARIELTNQAMREQAQAGERLTAIQRRINDVTGVSRPDARGSAAAAADILLEADAMFRRAEARDAEIRQLREQEAARARLADAEQAERANRARFGITDDPRGDRARESAAAFIAAADAEDMMEREARQLRAELDPLAAIQDRYNAGLARYRELATAGKISTAELAAAQSRLATEAEQARLALGRSAMAGAQRGRFGLRPYELTNLGYQANDVFAQLASGTSLTQTLAQQGPQILQLFPRVGSAIVGAFKNPAFLGAAAVLAGIVVGLKKAGDEAERLRDYTANLTFRPDGGRYNAAELAKVADTLERLGATAKDADAAVMAFVDGGVAPDVMRDLARAAQETAERLGQSLPDAARAAAEAFSGGYQAVAEFDDKLNFLTASEREHIRALFDAGKATAAQTEARAAYQRIEDGIARKSRGPWAEAARSLGAAWDALVSFIADSAPIRIMADVMNNLAAAVKGVGDAIKGVLGDDAPAARSPTARVQARISAVQAEIRGLESTIRDYEAAIAKGIKSPVVANAYARIVERSREQLERTRAELARLEGRVPEATEDPNSAAAKRRSDRLAEIGAESELQRLRDDGGRRVLSMREQAWRIELAGAEAARNEADAQVAAALRRKAVAEETGKIEEESAARAAERRRDEERAVRTYLGNIVGAEGGTGRNRAGSSALGAGQFTRGTFVGLYRRLNPGTQLNDDQIADLRRNTAVAKNLLEVFTRDNVALLKKLGAAVNGANLYLLHFLGSGDGAAALRAGPDASIGDVIGRNNPRNAPTIFRQNAAYLRTERGKGRFRTVTELQAFLGDKVGDEVGNPNRAASAIVRAEANLIDDARERQDAFNLSVRQGSEDRQRQLDALTAERGLLGEALLAEQRRQAVATAALELRQRAEQANRDLEPGEAPVTLSPAQVVEAERLAGALFDAEHAADLLNARLSDRSGALAALERRRELMREQVEFLRSIGDNASADQLEASIDGVNVKIREATDSLIAFYAALSPDERVQLGIVTQAELDNVIAGLERARQASQEWGKVAGLSARDVAQAFASAAVNGFTNFIRRVAEGKNVFKALGASIREFAANFAAAIAQMILQLLAYAAAVAVLRALGVPVPGGNLFGGGAGSAPTGGGFALKGAGGFMTSAGVFHQGGVVGSSGAPTRTLPASLFGGAVRRFHNGGVVGFAPDEVPAVLQRGEEVIRADDPRHRMNGGLGSKPNQRLEAGAVF
jgi:hypothetical protein